MDQGVLALLKVQCTQTREREELYPNGSRQWPHSVHWILGTTVLLMNKLASLSPRKPGIPNKLPGKRRLDL